MAAAHAITATAAAHDLAAPARYVGRFAPTPSGPLHAGSLVAALASWLDARAWNGGRGGRWLVRIEDVDAPRCAPGADAIILSQLAACGLLPDAPVQWQSARGALYQRALDALAARRLAYPCACSRKDIAAALAAQGQARARHGELRYPGTCRSGLHGRPARCWRLNTTGFDEKAPQPQAPDPVLHWYDRRLGAQQQQVASAVGDFVLRRGDGCWAYQLAVVVDDGDQGVTDVVRGADLADNTPRQILLQRLLALARPRYLHLPLVYDANHEKLSKRNGAAALDLRGPAQACQALLQAASVLGLAPPAAPDAHTICLSDTLAHCVAAWQKLQWPA